MLRPFFSFYGSKWRAGAAYPPPKYDTIIEPFCGSAGYSLRYPDRNVILSDLDENIVQTWEYLIGVSSSEIERLPLWGEGDWESPWELKLPIGARLLIGWWLGKGLVRPSGKPMTWMRSEGSLGANYWGPEVRARVASQVEYIRHWKIALGSYEENDDWRATWFIDPPYEKAGRSYRKNKVDFGALGEWCLSRHGQVIVCEAVGATWLPFEEFGDFKGSSGKGRSGVSREAIWYRDE